MRRIFTKLSVWAVIALMSVPAMGQRAESAAASSGRSRGEEQRRAAEKVQQKAAEVKLRAASEVELRATAKPWPDSTVTFSTKDEKMFKTVNTYNADGYRTLAETYKWETNKWMNSAKTVYTLDTNGNATLSEGFSWDGNKWMNSSKYVYAYDAAGHQILYEYYRWVNNAWVGTAKWVNAYDAAGRQTLYEYYNNWENNAWVGIYRYVYAYDAAGHRTLYESYDWGNKAWVGNSKSTYVYDNKGDEILSVSYSWNNNQWVLSREDHYEKNTANPEVYVAHGTTLSDQGEKRTGIYLYDPYNGFDYGWVFPEGRKYEYKATYNSKGYLTLVEASVLNSGKRELFNKFIISYENNHPVLLEEYRENALYRKVIYQYDTKGHITLFESYRKDDKNQMYVRAKAMNTYDANGNQTYAEFYRWNAAWNVEAGKLIGSSKYARTYDATGRELSYENYYWDVASDKWSGSNKYARTYDADGRESSYERYIWSTEGGKWVGDYRITYDERNNKGDAVVYSSYSWINDQWNKMSYTVSYPKNYFPTGTETVASSAYAWNNDGNLHVRTGKATTLYIYTISGALYRQQTVTAGETTITALPKGVYVVAFGNKERQKVLVN